MEYGNLCGDEYCFDSQMYLLGYIPAHNRIYVCDKDVNIFAYSLSLSVIEYQTAILRNDLEAAEALLPSIPGMSKWSMLSDDLLQALR